jgi:hypothetical protein
MSSKLNFGIWQGIGLNDEDVQRIVDNQIELLRWTLIDLAFVRDYLEQDLEGETEILNRFLHTEALDHSVIARFNRICDRLSRSILLLFHELKFDPKLTRTKVAEAINRADQNVMVCGPLFADTPFEDEWKCRKSVE